MADGVKLLAGGPSAVYVLAFGAFCALAQIFLDYHRYVAFLKWLTLTLFTYVGALTFVEVPWGEALRGLLIPRISWSNEFLTTLVAILGTTSRPICFSGKRRRKPKTSACWKRPSRWSRRRNKPRGNSIASAWIH